MAHVSQLNVISALEGTLRLIYILQRHFNSIDAVYLFFKDFSCYLNPIFNVRESFNITNNLFLSITDKTTNKTTNQRTIGKKQS